LLIEAIKELSKKVEELENKLKWHCQPQILVLKTYGKKLMALTLQVLLVC
jgi:hypothetical protein